MRVVWPFRTRGCRARRGWRCVFCRQEEMERSKKILEENMKKFAFLFVGLLLGLLLATGAIAAPGDGINTTAHDLSAGSYAASPADAQTRICIFCHTPHHSYKLSPANGGPGAGVGSGDQAP